MGADGGSIPRRDELVKQKRKAEKKDKDADLANKWRYCALSSEKLRKPIVSCPLGRLYNKEAIIEFLINKDDFKTNTAVSHIRNLKDIVELHFTEKKCEPTDNDSQQLSESNYICPVTSLEMNGNYRFSYLKGCGCVISERAFKEIKSDVCLKCNRPFTSDDLIPLNGTDEEIESLRTKMEEARSKAKSEKSKKRKLNEDEAMKASTSSSNGHKSKATKSSVVKTSATLLLPEKAKADYSIAKDPNASENFKSLFTTHKSAKNQTKNNWVTFNPMYNR